MLNGKSFTAARTNAGKIVGTAFASGLKFWTVINGELIKPSTTIPPVFDET